VINIHHILILTIGLSLLTIHKINAQEKESKPNILLIMVDDLNDYQGAFGGHPQALTPNIDRLAETGTRFKNAHTNVPVCSPSRNSLFTGVYPHKSRDFGWTPHFKQHVLKNHKTFIELFKENGYKTFGTGKLLHANVRSYWDAWGVPEHINYGPHAYSGIDKKGKRLMGHSSVPEPFRSINVVDGSFAPLSDTPSIIDSLGNRIETGWTYGKKAYRYKSDEDRDLMPDEQHALWVAEKLSSYKATAPFFMGIGFVNPHTPLYVPKKYFDKFPLESIILPNIKEHDLRDTHYKNVYPDSEMGLSYFKKLKMAYPDGNEGLKRFLQAYLACINFMDEQVGVVLDALEKSKFKDNTIIILASDHGWQMGEKDYLYKNSPWERSTRIPLIIKAPLKKASKKAVTHPVSLIDIFPTLIDFCQLEGVLTKNNKTSKLDGVSLKPFVQNPNTKNWKGPNGVLTVLGAGVNKPIEGLGYSRNKGALWHVEISGDLEEVYVKKQNYSYRTKKWRYILYKDGSEELYNSLSDPNEWVNLESYKKYKKVKIKLKNELLNFID
jgi:arylsulfatase A-like enzyme